MAGTHADAVGTGSCGFTEKMMRGMESDVFKGRYVTFNDIRDKSLQQWLDEMEQHQDVAVQGRREADKRVCAVFEG